MQPYHKLSLRPAARILDATLHLNSIKRAMGDLEAGEASAGLEPAGGVELAWSELSVVSSKWVPCEAVANPASSREALASACRRRQRPPPLTVAHPLAPPRASCQQAQEAPVGQRVRPGRTRLSRDHG